MELIIELFRPNNDALKYENLGSDFAEEHEVASKYPNIIYRIFAEKQTSLVNNIYFEYKQSELPLPDGLNTKVRV